MSSEIVKTLITEQRDCWTLQLVKLPVQQN